MECRFPLDHRAPTRALRLHGRRSWSRTPRKQPSPRVLFPVGGYSKAQVREMARERGLPIADRDESMEICFVTDDDYRRFLREHAPEAVRPGPILDTSG